MKRLFVSIFLLILLLIGVFFIARTMNPLQTRQSRLTVMTSFYPLYFFASQIAGDKATVYSITPAGAEPHDYEPTAQDIARIEDSKLLILNGGKLEAWGDTIRDTLKGTQTAVLSVGDVFTDRNVIANEAIILDPHVWLDPLLAKKEADAIAKELARIDPTNALYYEHNLGVLKARLDNLDKEYRVILAQCAKKDIITSHAAFGYLTREYGLTQVSISGLSPDEEPSPQKLAQVADFAKKNGITYIFFESLVSPKLSETIAREVGIKTLVLNPIEGLSDEEIAQGKNYLTEMEHNLTNLTIALQCQ